MGNLHETLIELGLACSHIWERVSEDVPRWRCAKCGEVSA